MRSLPNLSTNRFVIARFYAFRAFVAEGFVHPIIVIYALNQGLNLADIGLAMGVFYLGTLLGEVPTGYVGDRIGRRNGLVIGAISLAITQLGFAFSNTVAMFVVFYGLWGVAWTFRSGTSDAWLYDILGERDATERFTRIRGRGESAYFGSAAITALVGGVLYEMSPTFPFFAAAFLAVLAAVVVATLPEPSQVQSESFSLSGMRTALEAIVTTRQVALFSIFSAVLLSVPETVDVFVQPIARSVGFQPSTLGPLYTGLLLAAAAGAWLAPSIQHWLGVERWFTFGPVLLVGLLVLTIPVHVVAIPAFFVSRGFQSVSTTLGSKFLNQRIPSTGRATTLSGVSMLYALVNFVARAGSGAVASATSSFVALATIGGVSIAILVLIRVRFDPFDDSPPANGP